MDNQRHRAIACFLSQKFQFWHCDSSRFQLWRAHFCTKVSQYYFDEHRMYLVSAWIRKGFPKTLKLVLKNRAVVRLSARFNKGVTENSTQSKFWLSQSLLIACGSFIANFEPALKSRIFEIAILKISTVLYHVKIWWSRQARTTLVSFLCCEK